MPELPEVQTIVSDLRKKIIGRRIIDVWFDAPYKLNSNLLKNLKITDIKRHGKNILIYLNQNSKNNFILLIHQKMTGHLLYGKWRIEKIANSKFHVSSLLKGPLEEKVNNYIHFILHLDNDWQVGLSDLRKFAKIVFGSREKIENLPELIKLGPDPLDASFKFIKFIKLIRSQKRKIKQVLMDQNILTGIGNIYADEILWQAKIHPLKPANTLKETELKKIFGAMQEILTKAVKLRGTSVSDFRDANGRPGGYGNIRKAYQREGEPCPRCETMIKRIKIGGRSAHFCPKCQKL